MGRWSPQSGAEDYIRSSRTFVLQIQSRVSRSVQQGWRPDESWLRERLEIPVFHDDQHGTAIIAAAGLINALHLTGRDISDIRVVSNGAGAASIACVELFKSMGVPHENIILVDRSGVIYQGREASMNQWKSAHAVKTDARMLEDALVGADVFLGLACKGPAVPV